MASQRRVCLIKDRREAKSLPSAFGKKAYQAWRSKGFESVYMMNSEMASEGGERGIK